MTEPTPDSPLRYGAYLLLSPATLALDVIEGLEQLTVDLGFANEFSVELGHPEHAFALLKRERVWPASIEDIGVQEAKWIIHAASPLKDSLGHFLSRTLQLMPSNAVHRVLRGVVRPRRYTSGVIDHIAYRDQLQQQSGTAMPVCFFHPMSKTRTWWEMDGLEQQTYFLPRYEDRRMTVEGHVLASVAGLSALTRRTYRAESHPAQPDRYDFLNFFECSPISEPVFHSVLAALRDTRRNPEWSFVAEGPLWRGKRIESWSVMAELP